MIQAEPTFDSMQAAVQALLVDVTSFINSTGHSYLIIGGWSPVLRNTTSCVHPGTRDIDILFADANVRDTLADVISGLLKRGYKVSAKHDFQLLRVINVQGHELVFNVDLLHPSETVKNPEMMVDHFDLGITDRDLGDSKHIKSIVLPSSQLLFLEGFYDKFDLEAQNLAGDKEQVSFPLLGLAGLILSKCESVKAPKRPRDAFDILVAIESDTKQEIVPLLQRHKQLQGVQDLLASLRGFVSKAPDPGRMQNDFDGNVFRYWHTQWGADVTPSDRVIDLLAQI
jgi:hypothetical protein